MTSPTLNLVARTASEISLSNDRNELHKAVLGALSALGFSDYSLSCRKRDTHQLLLEPTLTSWTSGWIDTYYDSGWHRTDPMLAHYARSGPAMIWSPTQLAASPQHREFGAYLALSGLTGGISVPLGSKPNDISGMVAVSYDGAPISPQTAEAVQVIGHLAANRAEIIGLVDQRRPGPNPLDRLSARQHEILHWATQGKSNRSIAQLLAITPRVTTHHMSEILRKLGVATRTQAVALYALHNPAT